VAEARNGTQDPSPGLVRLPPGRHGLPREVVAQNQRDRLIAGIIATVAEVGYNDATISNICAAAGISRRTFYTYFRSKEECFFAAYDAIAEHVLATVREASAREGSWPQKVRAAIAGALEVFAANPDLARFTLIEPPRAGEKISARLRAAGDVAVAELTRGKPKRARTISSDVERALLAGMAAVVSQRVEAGRGGDLLSLQPELVELFLTPYIGRDKAVAIARD